MSDKLVLMERAGAGSIFVKPEKVGEYLDDGWRVSDDQPMRPAYPILEVEMQSEPEAQQPDPETEEPESEPEPVPKRSGSRRKAKSK